MEKVLLRLEIRVVVVVPSSRCVLPVVAVVDVSGSCFLLSPRCWASVSCSWEVVARKASAACCRASGSCSCRASLGVRRPARRLLLVATAAAAAAGSCCSSGRLRAPPVVFLRCLLGSFCCLTICASMVGGCCLPSLLACLPLAALGVGVLLTDVSIC
jgi:hypothetical protein